VSKLLLHIGVGKTGTTAIQEYFSTQGTRGKLNYLPAGVQHLGHHGIAAALMGNDRYDWLLPYRIEQLRQEIAELKASDQHYFASSEAICNGSFIDLGGVSQLAGLFDGWDVDILIYVRNQVSLYESSFLQRCKTGGYHGSAEDFLDYFNQEKAGNFVQKILPFVETFGQSQVHVVAYEDYRKNILQPIEDITGSSLPRDNLGKANVTGSVLSALVLQNIARMTGTRLIGNQYHDFRRFVEANIVDTMDSPTIVNTSMATEIRAQYQQENEELQRLFGVDLGPLETNREDRPFYSEQQIAQATAKLLLRLIDRKND